MSRLNKKLFSLRSRVILTLSLLVIIVSSTLVYFSSDMIYQDKRAYLYEDSFQAVTYSLKQLEHSLVAKKRMIEGSLPRNEGSLLIDKDFWQKDEHLYQIKTFSYDETGMTGQEVVYENSSYKDAKSKKAHPRVISFNAIEGFFKEAREQGLAKTLIHESKAPPRFLVMAHLPEAKTFVMFDFLVDKILSDIFSHLPYDITIINKIGKAFYNNRPYNVSPKQEAFYKNFVSSLGEQETAQSGVKEIAIGEIPHILSFSRSQLFKDYYTLAAIKTVDAYEVTTVFILKTALYALGLVGFFNIIALILARSVTNPLDALNQTITRISEGEYTARVEPQKIKELEIVGHSFNLMVDKIQEYNEQLKEYNRSLEQKVEDRTSELREANNFIHAMVDSLSQGLLVFSRDGICHGTYTKSCLALLGRNPSDKEIVSLIKHPDPESFKTWIGALFDEPMPFEELLAFGPDSIPVDLPWTHSEFKHVGLEFFPMRNDEDKVENIVMVATDKTKEFQAAKENEVQQSYISMLSKVLKDRETFARFVGQFQQSMLESKGNPNLDRMNFMRLVHSLKGMASFFSLGSVVDYLHQFENDIPSESFDMSTVGERIDKALELLEVQVSQISQFSPEILNPSQKIEIDESKLTEFYEMLKPMDQDYALHFKHHFLDRPVESYIEQYKTLVLDLALKLGKKINPLVVNNGSLKVDRKAFQPFFDSCIHLFRNSVDHGIEMPYKRQELNKLEAGTITLSFDLKTVAGKQYLYFEMKDDGGGISLDAIRNKMRKLGYSPEEIEEKDDRLILFRIFDPQFSTAEVTTDISGRGIGLFDIKNLVEQYQGNIIVETQVGGGTTFAFYLSYV